VHLQRYGCCPIVVKSNFISLQKVVCHCLKLYIVEILAPIEDGPVIIFYDISADLYHYLLSFLTLFLKSHMMFSVFFFSGNV
jgi:hypothetical protein